jgi:tetratricopeptide (TPR) repeat protein
MSPAQVSFSSGYLLVDHLLWWLFPFGRQNIMGAFVWGKTATAMELAASWLGLALLAVLAFRFRRSLPLVSFGLAWFVVGMAPTCNLIPVQNNPFADYYMVLPSLGLAVAFIAVARRGWEIVHGSAEAAGPAGVAALIALIGLGGLRAAAVVESFVWARAWNSPPELYARSVDGRRYSFASRTNLARLLKERGYLEEAEALARESMREAPWYEMSYNVLGDIARESGQYEEALRLFEEAARVQPGSAYPILAGAYLLDEHLDQPARARERYQSLLALPWNRYSEEAAVMLSRRLALDGAVAEAIGVMETALEKVPNSRTLHYNLGRAYAQAGDDEKARIHRETAARLQPRAEP